MEITHFSIDTSFYIKSLMFSAFPHQEFLLNIFTLPSTGDLTKSPLTVITSSGVSEVVEENQLHQQDECETMANKKRNGGNRDKHRGIFLFFRSSAGVKV